MRDKGKAVGDRLIERIERINVAADLDSVGQS